MADVLPPEGRPRFIVAEITKNYEGGMEVEASGPINGLFEQVLAANTARGYQLTTFTLSQVYIPAEMLHGQYIRAERLVETILAVFGDVRGR